MKKSIMTIRVATYESCMLQSSDSSVVMIPFSAEAEGKYFSGKTLMNGVDTQITAEGRFSLSARYMLEGTDCSGKKCRLFIENNGTSLDNCRPKIFTDSSELAFLEKADLSAAAECVENGVIIHIYQNC